MRSKLLIAGVALALLLVPAALLLRRNEPSSAEDPRPKGFPPPAEEPVDTEKLQADSEAAQDRFAVEEFPTLGLDPARLDRTEFLASYDIRSETLAEVTLEASDIAEIEGASVSFEAGARAVTAARVVRSWKGQFTAGGSITFVQHATPMRHPDGPVYLAQQDVAPALSSGDRAILFLKRVKHGSSDELAVIPAAGWFQIDRDGIIHTAFLPEGFGKVDGLTLDQFAALIRAAVE